VEGFPEGEILSRVESPEGELAYFIKADGTARLSRIHFHEPSVDYPLRHAYDMSGYGGLGSFDSLLGNFFSKPVTRRSSGEPHEFSGPIRGSIICTIEQCVYCSKCAAHCPAKALTVSKAERTWSINPFRCVLCGECVEVCPEKALGVGSQREKPGRKPDNVVFHITGTADDAARGEVKE
jgi:ech hydrogenase subunit F